MKNLGKGSRIGNIYAPSLYLERFVLHCTGELLGFVLETLAVSGKKYYAREAVQTELSGNMYTDSRSRSNS